MQFSFQDATSMIDYRVVQLNFTPEIEYSVFYMLFES